MKRPEIKGRAHQRRRGKLDPSARGVNEEEHVPAAKLGVTKVNIDTDGRLVWTRVLPLSSGTVRFQVALAADERIEHHKRDACATLFVIETGDFYSPRIGQDVRR